MAIGEKKVWGVDIVEIQSIEVDGIVIAKIEGTNRVVRVHTGDIASI